jgi:hypothetical protein
MWNSLRMPREVSNWCNCGARATSISSSTGSRDLIDQLDHGQQALPIRLTSAPLFTKHYTKAGANVLCFSYC